MELAFEKLNGLGNDFIFIDGTERDIVLSAEQVSWLCDRHFGIGADGVIVVRPAEDADGYMHYINSDGTLAQMCGNGVRCFAKYLVDHGMVDASGGSLVAGTLAGPRPIAFELNADGKLAEATVEMGRPVTDPAEVPCLLPATAMCQGAPAAVKVPIESPWGTFRFTAVSMGNPHAVCFVDHWQELPDSLFSDPSDKRLQTLRIDDIGAWFESNPAFPEKTNVEFASVVEGGIEMRVFERGCGETLACGTGACATAVAGCLTGRTDRASKVMLLGGDLFIDWGADGVVRMTGPAAFAYAGTVTL
ncbi:MAG: diaminopimelate epimerase [Eggerthellaceae bacterium]|nr:diaminopimelate epimerase [Eggerthellaceae bacterium]